MKTTESNMVGRLRGGIVLVAGPAGGIRDLKATEVLMTEAADEIERLRDAIIETLEENLHLADGENCTLIRLKRALPPNDPSSPTAADGAGERTPKI